MLNVICVYKSGGEYDIDYVLRLRAGVKRHLSLNHHFICLTDTVHRTRFDDDNMIQWEPLLHDWPRWWSKVEMFRPELGRYGRMFYLDLSCIITGNLDDIASYDGDACVTSDFYYGGPSQSVLNFAPGSMADVWEIFNDDPGSLMAQGDLGRKPDFGDQLLFNIQFGHDGLDRWQDLYPGQVVSYKVHCKDGLPENARLVKFHGKPRIHDCDDPWVQEAWTGQLLF